MSVPDGERASAAPAFVPGPAAVNNVRRSPPTLPRVSRAWQLHGPRVLEAASAVQVAVAHGAIFTSSADGALCQLARSLVDAYREGAFGALQEELPRLLLHTGQPYQVSAQIMARILPRLPTPPKPRNVTAETSPNVLSSLLLFSSDLPSDAAAAAATFSPASSSLSLPLHPVSSWFTSAVSRAPLLVVGSANAHSLQSLLLSSVASLSAALSSATAPPVPPDVQAFARDVLVPMWVSTPPILMQLLTVFGLDAELTSADHEYFASTLVSRGHGGAALTYLSHFGLADRVDPEPLLIQMLLPNAPHGSEAQAIDAARTCPSFRAPLINLLTSVAHKSAVSLKLIDRFGLEPNDFPIVLADVRFKQIKWLVREGKGVELGPEVCGFDSQLQRTLVKCMLKARHTEDARAMMEAFALTQDPALLQRLAEAETLNAANPPRVAPPQPHVDYLRLPSSVPVVFVTASDPASLDAAAVNLSPTRTDIVGLDVEFGFTGSFSNQPALLQIATRTEVMLFDLLTLEASPRMGDILTALFRNESALKVGYAWDGDWRILRAGFPHADCFRHQTNVIDMADPARAMDREERVRQHAKEVAERQASQAQAAAQPASAAAQRATPTQQVRAPAQAEAEDIAEAEEVVGDDADADVPMDTTASQQDTTNPAAASPSQTRVERRRMKKQSKRSAARSANSTTGAGDASAADDIPKGVARGLSSLSQFCLGLPLDKTWQISAWRRRPLKAEQVHYAALDAFCLIGIYDAFFGPTPNPAIVDLRLPTRDTFLQMHEAPKA